MKRRFFIPIAVLFLLLGVAEAQTTGQREKDSLRNVIAHLEGKEKLRAYNRLANLYFVEAYDSQKRDTLFALYDEMDAEAKKQGDDSQRGVVRGNKLLVLNHSSMYDEVIRLAPDYMKFVEEKQLWKIYYAMYLPLMLAYQYGVGDNEKAMSVAREMYDHAKARKNNIGMGMAFYNMSRIYSNQRRYTKMEEFLREAIVLLQDSTSALNVLADVYSELGQSLIIQERFEEAIQIANQMDAVILRYEEASRSRQPNARMQQFEIYIDAYMATDEYDKAEIYCNKLDSITNGTRRGLIEYRARILALREQYTEALKLIDQAIEMDPGEKIRLMGFKAGILVWKGDAEAAEQIYFDLYDMIDEQYDMELNAQLDAIRTEYEVDKIQAQKERLRIYLLFAFGGCLLLALLLGGYIYYSRLVLKKNRALFRQIKEQDTLIETLEQITRKYEALEQAAESEPAMDKAIAETIVSALPGNRQQRAFVARFHNYLIHDDTYKNPTITLDNIISALATNRTFLFEAVKTVTDKTPSDYINMLRLEETKRMLETNFNLNIDIIAETCGFNSRATFYRAFREHYHINPAEYRRIAGEQN
jgi:AraC-like DNA-binding protein